MVTNNLIHNFKILISITVQILFGTMIEIKFPNHFPVLLQTRQFAVSKVNKPIVQLSQITTKSITKS